MENNEKYQISIMTSCYTCFGDTGLRIGTELAIKSVFILSSKCWI